MNFVSSLASAALIVVGSAGLCARAEAQGATGTQPSAHSDGSGLVFVGAILLDGGNLVDSSRPCPGIEIGLGQVTNGKYLTLSVQQGMYKAWGVLKHYEPIALKTGQWYVGSVKCQRLVGLSGSGGTTYRGPYAKFQVKAGEVVDVGTLKLQYSVENLPLRKGKIRTSMELTNQERLAETRKQTPALMSKLVTRPMILVGPPEREVVMRPGS